MDTTGIIQTGVQAAKERATVNSSGNGAFSIDINHGVFLTQMRDICTEVIKGISVDSWISLGVVIIIVIIGDWIRKHLR